VKSLVSSIFLAFVLLAALFVSGPAVQCEAAEEGGAVTPVLEPVTVVSTIDVKANGVSRLSRDVIDRLPQGNGSINELLEVLPDVQFSENFKSSLTAGEILPPDVSISGGKVFQNQYLIDGLDNNSLLDPTARNPNDISDVPGHPQKLFLDSRLAEEVVLYDSNIPARYGQFSGGVVDVVTRSPAERFGVSLDYRHTRDEWTSFHLNDADRGAFQQSGSATAQPEFSKHHGGASIDLPVNERLGVLLDYHQLYSDIPLLHLGEQQSQSRRNENFFAKAVFDQDADRSWDLSLLYAPYEADYFVQDAAQSRFVIDGGGLTTSLNHYRFFDQGNIRLQASFSDSENSREAPQNWRLWAVSPSRPWGQLVGSDYSREGGFGNLDKEQQDLEFNIEVNWEPATPGVLEQSLNGGLQTSWTRGSYERSQQAVVYKEPRLSPDVICGPDLFACIDGEQFLTRRNVYRSSRTEEEINALALYLDDTIAYRRLSVRPGVRLDYDDYLENLNLAPRLAVEYDLFGDGSTLLTGGLNRYYGRSFLTFKLREGKLPPAAEYRSTVHNQVTAWQPYPDTLRSVARFSGLDTPYSDEVVLGFDQLLLGGQLSGKYVRRRGHDEFARQYGPVQADGLRYYTVNNNGSSEHDSYRLSWERAWEKQYLLLTWTYQESSSSNENYDTVLDDEELQTRVWYQNQIVYKSELPRRDYNRPHAIELLWTTALPGGFSFTNFTRYLSSYHSLENTWEERSVPDSEQRFDFFKGEPVAESLYVYDDVKRGDELVFDWKLAWHGSLFGVPGVGLRLDIFNVFNRKIESGLNPGEYQLGRQVWAGMDFSY